METQSVLNDIGRCADLNGLLQRVAGDNDARAAVYVYDYMKDKGVTCNEASWVSLHKLERNRNPILKYTVPTKDRALPPSRRIHKICKGVRLHERSEAAKDIMPQVNVWLSHREPNFSQLDRISQAKMLAKDLTVPLETARGAITKLKQQGKL